VRSRHLLDGGIRRTRVTEKAIVLSVLDVTAVAHPPKVNRGHRDFAGTRPPQPRRPRLAVPTTAFEKRPRWHTA